MRADGAEIGRQLHFRPDLSVYVAFGQFFFCQSSLARCDIRRISRKSTIHRFAVSDRTRACGCYDSDDRTGIVDKER